MAQPDRADADPRETTGGYRPPDGAEGHEWWALGAKCALALLLSAWACRAVGLSGVTTAVIAAGFLVAIPPVAAIRTTLLRVAAMFGGVALGVAGAVLGLGNGGEVPAWFFLGFGAIVGIAAAWKAELTYVAVIGAVVAGAGARGSGPVVEVAAETCAQLVIGSAVTVAVIWTFEAARARWGSRRS